jgi:hypothetical protein
LFDKYYGEDGEHVSFSVTDFLLPNWYLKVNRYCHQFILNPDYTIQSVRPVVDIPTVDTSQYITFNCSTTHCNLSDKTRQFGESAMTYAKRAYESLEHLDTVRGYGSSMNGCFISLAVDRDFYNDYNTISDDHPDLDIVFVGSCVKEC